MTMGTGGIFGVPYGSRRKRGGLFDPQLETPNSVEMAPPLGSDFDEEDPKKGLLGFWQGGDKFTARDGIAGLLAAVGDAFAQENGMEGSAVSGLTGGRAKAMAEAKKAEQEQQLMQAGIAAGATPEQMALIRGGAANWNDFKQSPYRFEDNAGNVWELGADGKPKRIFTDMAPKQYFQDGQFVTVSNPYATANSSYDPNEWGGPVDKLPGGASSNAGGTFRYR